MTPPRFNIGDRVILPTGISGTIRATNGVECLVTPDDKPDWRWRVAHCRLRPTRDEQRPPLRLVIDNDGAELAPCNTELHIDRHFPYAKSPSPILPDRRPEDNGPEPFLTNPTVEAIHFPPSALNPLVSPTRGHTPPLDAR